MTTPPPTPIHSSPPLARLTQRFRRPRAAPRPPPLPAAQQRSPRPSRAPYPARIVPMHLPPHLRIPSCAPTAPPAGLLPAEALHHSCIPKSPFCIAPSSSFPSLQLPSHLHPRITPKSLCIQPVFLFPLTPRHPNIPFLQPPSRLHPYITPASLYHLHVIPVPLSSLHPSCTPASLLHPHLACVPLCTPMSPHPARILPCTPVSPQLLPSHLCTPHLPAPQSACIPLAPLHLPLLPHASLHPS